MKPSPPFVILTSNIGLIEILNIYIYEKPSIFIVDEF